MYLQNFRRILKYTTYKKQNYVLSIRRIKQLTNTIWLEINIQSLQRGLKKCLFLNNILCNGM